MRIKPAGDLPDDVMREHIEFLQGNAKGTDFTLSAAPTETAPLLEDDEDGIYDGVLYKRKGSTIYVFTPGSTIAIT